ncbi:hypothetical protein MMC07_005115 [Pseudocyphellaria aurata]|nr:hypothetical protein [Pseudocyphellaria aurata]
MQTKIFLFAALLSTISSVTAEPAPQPAAQTTPPSPAQTSKALHDLDVYYSSLTAAPQWPSYSSVLATAFDTATFDFVADDLSDITTQPEFTGLPKNVQDYVVSVNKAANSVVSKDLSGAAPRPTGAVMAAGAAAAGLLGVVAML